MKLTKKLSSITFSLLFVMCFGLSVSLSSCGGDDDNQSGNNSSMVENLYGSWLLTYEKGIESDGDEWEDFYYDSSEERIELRFIPGNKASLTLYLSYGTEKCDYIYNVDGNIIHMYSENPDDKDFGDVDLKIISLTSKSLKV